MQLTSNFSLEEMTYSATAARMRISNIPDEEGKMRLKTLCEKILQPVRDRIGEPVVVTSAYRSARLNKAVGGVKNSQHQYGEAADIKCKDNKALWKLMAFFEGRLILKGQD